MRIALRNRQNGFSLAEVLIATVIASYAMMSSWSVNGAVSAKYAMDADPIEAAQLAREIYECAELLPTTPSGTTGVTAGADVVALDSLIGASFSPPIFADGTPNTAYAGWTQQVSLDVHALADLGTKTADDPTAGLGSNDGKLYKLTVKMLKAGVEQDTFSWWISP
jgi:prepilin-type N-terminal cleavage/methylation domain-containing protein